MHTLYWHDYETWGTDPSVDRPSQFAGVRTNESLDIVAEPLVIYCQPAPDVLPHPEACLVTGIAPQKALSEGLTERDFIALIHAELAQPNTCGVGYNSIRFDDEVTRYTLYRNFYDPYEREWRNGNSRWDIIDMLRLCYALRPEGIEWPVIDDKVSFKLESLTAANGINHRSAHDAYSDVEATIAMARLVKERQPALYDYVYQHRRKMEVARLLDVAQRKPLLHVSSRFAAEHGCTALVVPLAKHPVNSNAVIVFDLSEDPSVLWKLDVEAIRERVFTAQDQLPESERRIPLKLVHLNKCPVLVTPKLLDEKTAQRLAIDKQRCESHWQELLRHDLAAKVQQVFAEQSFEPRADPERQLYDGFFSPADRAQMAAVRDARAEQLATQMFAFADRRLPELLYRYRARNFPSSLSAAEKMQWREFCKMRLERGDEGCLSIQELKRRIEQIDGQGNLKKDEKIVLQQLFRYANDLAREFELSAKCCW